MNKERMFYIAYRICDYVRKADMQCQFEEYEFCMYVSNVVNDMKHAIKHNDVSAIEPYYEMLNDEIANFIDDNNSEKYIIEVKELIELLDECKVYIIEQ